jgi:hypothetical protein
VRKVDNLTAIYEPIVKVMWDPYRLTTLWAFTARYRDSFTLLFMISLYAAGLISEVIDRCFYLIMPVYPSLRIF